MSVSSINETNQYLTFKLENEVFASGHRQGPGSP